MRESPDLLTQLGDAACVPHAATAAKKRSRGSPGCPSWRTMFVCAYSCTKVGLTISLAAADQPVLLALVSLGVGAALLVPCPAWLRVLSALCDHRLVADRVQSSTHGPDLVGAGRVVW